jgi:hypothetical protein
VTRMNAAVQCVRRRSPDLTAVLFDGSFPLDFLQNGEHVAVRESAPVPGTAVVVKDGKVQASVAPGGWLLREEDGTLIAVDGDDFERLYEVASGQ